MDKDTLNVGFLLPGFLLDSTDVGILKYYCPLNYKKGESNFLHARSWAYFLYMTSPLSSFQYL